MKIKSLFNNNFVLLGILACIGKLRQD